MSYYGENPSNNPCFNDWNKIFHPRVTDIIFCTQNNVIQHLRPTINRGPEVVPVPIFQGITVSNINTLIKVLHGCHTNPVPVVNPES